MSDESAPPKRRAGQFQPGAANHGKPFQPGIPNGKQPFQPNDEQRKTVELFAGYGIPQDAIAAHIGCDRKTLALYFREELDEGKTQATVKVAARLFQHATGDSVPAAIFWMKTQAGWRERHEITGAGGDPVQMVMQIVTGVPRDDDEDEGEES